MPPKNPGKVDWVGVGTLLVTATVPMISTLIGLGLYLIGWLNQIDSRLHEFDVRFTRIETRMGIDEPAKKVANLEGSRDEGTNQQFGWHR